MSDVTKAALWMVGALASFTTMGICGRELAGELTTFQILFWRSVVGVLIIGFLVSRAGPGTLKTSSMKIHGLRNIAHFGGQFGWFYAIGVIPLVEAFSLEFTVPILTALMASVFLGERLTPARIIAILFGFLGVLVILRPGVVSISLGSVAALGAALGYATSGTATRFLAQRDTALSILFFMTVMQLPMGFFPALYDWKWPEPHTWPWLVLVGITAMTAHFTLARALRLVEAALVMPMEFARLPLIALVGYLFYGEDLEIWVAIGAAMICTGIFFNLRDAKGH